MAIPPDQQLAKLRIYLKRAKDEYEIADRMVLLAQEHRSTKHENALDAWHKYSKRCDEIGYCHHCEKLKTECEGHAARASLDA